MKQIILLAALTFTGALANAGQKLVCMESGQTSPFVIAEYSVSGEENSVTITKMGEDGQTDSEILQGTEPDLMITNAKTAEGEELVIIQSLGFNEHTMAASVRVLVCSQTNQ